MRFLLINYEYPPIGAGQPMHHGIWQGRWQERAIKSLFSLQRTILSRERPGKMA